MKTIKMFFIFLIIITIGCNKNTIEEPEDEETYTPLSVGDIAPKFTSFYFSNARIDDWDFTEAFKLSAYAGDPIFLNFITTNEESFVLADEVNDMCTNFDSSTIVFCYLIIDITNVYQSQGDTNILTNYISNNYDINLLCHKYQSTVYKQYLKSTSGQLIEFPTYYLIDKDGHIAYIHHGFDTNNFSAETNILITELRKLTNY